MTRFILLKRDSLNFLLIFIGFLLLLFSLILSLLIRFSFSYVFLLFGILILFNSLYYTIKKKYFFKTNTFLKTYLFYVIIGLIGDLLLA
jgi:hypothetical protein